MAIHYLKIVANRLLEFYQYKNVRQIKKSELDFKTSVMSNSNYQPIFFLSTGRTGTDFFTKLLNNSQKVQAFHSPSGLFCNAQSELIEQGKITYEMYEEYGLDDKRTNRLASQIFMASREKLLLTTYIHNKTYIETNNRVTFLAPAIKTIIPNAKFVHLYRHPGDFIRSGIRREYYNSTSEHELGRLVPIHKNKHINTWSHFDDIEKIAWLWNETNSFIENYLSTLETNDYFQFNFNDLSIKNIESLWAFLNINDIKKQSLKSVINKPTNIQKEGCFPKYKQWSVEDKEKVIAICGKLSENYGYKL